ncbi:MAG: LamG domain-containing protein, partial [Solirubrobacterales bacterium]
MWKRFSCGIALILILCLAPGAWAELVGHWRLDEGSGTTARDATGNGNDGTITDGTWVDGVIGGALQFNGTTSAVSCGDAANLAFTKPFSIACWVNPSDLAGDRAFVARAAAGVGYAFKTSSTHLRMTTPGVLDHDGNNSILQLNTWQHVAVTFTPGQASGCVFYINAIQTDALTASALTAGAGPFEIGHNFWAQWCLGMIDDVQVYDHVLTAAEVAKAME